VYYATPLNISSFSNTTYHCIFGNLKWYWQSCTVENLEGYVWIKSGIVPLTLLYNEWGRLLMQHSFLHCQLGLFPFRENFGVHVADGVDSCFNLSFIWPSAVTRTSESEDSNMGVATTKTLAFALIWKGTNVKALLVTWVLESISNPELQWLRLRRTPSLYFEYEVPSFLGEE